MILHTHSENDFRGDIFPVEIIIQPVINQTKKKRGLLKNIRVKIKVFFWNLSPFHWYDEFSSLKIDMNEFVKPKNKTI